MAHNNNHNNNMVAHNKVLAQLQEKDEIIERIQVELRLLKEALLEADNKMKFAHKESELHQNELILTQKELQRWKNQSFQQHDQFETQLKEAEKKFNAKIIEMKENNEKSLQGLQSQVQSFTEQNQLLIERSSIEKKENEKENFLLQTKIKQLNQFLEENEKKHQETILVYQEVLTRQAGEYEKLAVLNISLSDIIRSCKYCQPKFLSLQHLNNITEHAPSHLNNHNKINPRIDLNNNHIKVNGINNNNNNNNNNNLHQNNNENHNNNQNNVNHHPSNNNGNKHQNHNIANGHENDDFQLL